MATNANTPVVWLSDGPRLILADGSVVRPLVNDRDRDKEIHFVGGDQGAAIFGDALGDNEKVDIAFVDDPDVEDHEEVQGVLEEYGF